IYCASVHSEPEMESYSYSPSTSPHLIDVSAIGISPSYSSFISQSTSNQNVVSLSPADQRRTSRNLQNYSSYISVRNRRLDVDGSESEISASYSGEIIQLSTNLK